MALRALVKLMRNRIKRLERHVEDCAAQFIADIQELKHLIETGEPTEKHRIVDHDGNEVAGPIPDLSEP